jgi:hypothetical protein
LAWVLDNYHVPYAGEVDLDVWLKVIGTNIDLVVVPANAKPQGRA